MNKKLHPVYPNPTVTEAIIEIYLETSISKENLHQIFNQLKPIYPDNHRDELAVYQATIGKRRYVYQSRKTL